MSRKFGWVRAEDDPTTTAYGAFAGGINVSDVDLARFPGWDKLEWTDVQLEPGDCLLVPHRWFHHVFADEGERNLAVHMWFDKLESGFDESDCNKLQADFGIGRMDLSDEYLFTFRDCKFEQEGETRCNSNRAKSRFARVHSEL